MHIRTAELRDAPVITEYNLALALETENLRLDPACVSVGVEALLTDPAKGIYFLAELESKVVGQVMITYEWSDWRNANIWWLQSVYVAREFRNRGVFRALFRHVEQLAKRDRQTCGIWLYMHADNDLARRAYENLGIRQTRYLVFEKEMT